MMKINEEEPVFFVNEKLASCYATLKHPKKATVRITDFAAMTMKSWKDCAQLKRAQHLIHITKFYAIVNLFIPIYFYRLF